jgi:hypothetical protein
MLSKLGAVKIKITIAIETMITIKNASRRVFLCMHVKRILFGYNFFLLTNLSRGLFVRMRPDYNTARSGFE